MTLTLLLVSILTTWRLSSLLSREDGPFNILQKLRHCLGVRYDEASEPYGETELGRGVLCLWCNSIWVAAVVSGVTYVMRLVSLDLVVFMVFALSAGAILVDEVIN